MHLLHCANDHLLRDSSSRLLTYSNTVRHNATPHRRRPSMLLHPPLRHKTLPPLPLPAPPPRPPRPLPPHLALHRRLLRPLLGRLSHQHVRHLHRHQSAVQRRHLRPRRGRNHAHQNFFVPQLCAGCTDGYYGYGAADSVDLGLADGEGTEGGVECTFWEWVDCGCFCNAEGC